MLRRALVIVAFCAGVAFGSDDPASALDTVARYARAFWDDKHEVTASLSTTVMRAAVTPEKAAALKGRLVGTNGELTGIGTPWAEDRVGEYRRFRVPLLFERETVDLRIVLDTEGLVAGMFLVPHVDPAAARIEAPVREQEVRIGDEKSGLPGTLSLPDGKGPFPAVVLVHGSGPHDRDEIIGPNRPFRDLAWGLAQRGVAVLRYDKRTFADPASLAEVGAALTVRHEVLDDARAALAALRWREEIDGTRLFVLGHSLGGTVAPRIAAIEPRPAGVIVLAGATLPLPEKMLEQMRYIAGVDGETSPEERDRIEQLESTVRTLRAALDGKGEDPAGPLLGAPIGYYRDLEQHDPPQLAAASGLPYLVLQGGRDYQVTLDDFARWRAALGNRANACLVVYDDMDHLFRPGKGPSRPGDYERAEPVSQRVIGDIADWIVERRCPAEGTGDRAPATTAPEG